MCTMHQVGFGHFLPTTKIRWEFRLLNLAECADKQMSRLVRRGRNIEFWALDLLGRHLRFGRDTRFPPS